MKNKIIPTVEVADGIVKINRKRSSCESYLTLCQQVHCTKPEKTLKPKDSANCYIVVSSDIREKLKGDYCVLVNLDTGAFADVFVAPDVLPETTGDIRVTKYVQRRVGIDKNSSLAICTENYAEFSKVGIQLMKYIKSDIVSIPEGTVPEELLKKFSLFEIINTFTNDSILVKSKNIVINPIVKENEITADKKEEADSKIITMNMKHRKLLSMDVPARLTSEQWKILTANANEREVFEREYKEDGAGYTVSRSPDDMTPSSKACIKKAVTAAFGVNIILRPVLESFCYKERKDLITLLSDFYVGKSTLTLNCRRPHDCDENADVVRMTEDNMRFLGIEPMDRVVLRFKNKRKACHVLPYDSDKYTNTNIPGVIELSVGIPAHIRDVLEINDIRTSVKVDRDTGFIFRKSFNEQLVPILLALFSINIFDGLDTWISSLISIGLIPVIMYITLSPKRNMRGK